MNPPIPIVSIVTPCWNAAEFLHETYTSIKNQTLRRWEWIVVDDGSTDESVAVLERIALQDKRVHVIRNERAGRPSVGRNVGIRHARGKFIAFLDADDLFLPNKLKQQVLYLKKNPQTALCYHFVQEFWNKKSSDSPPPTYWARIDLERNAFETLMTRGNTVCTSSILVRRSVLEAIGPIDEAPELRAVEDYDILLRIAHRYRIGRVPGVLGRYRVHPSNITKSIDLTKNEAILERLKARGHLKGRPGAKYLSSYHFIRAEYGLNNPSHIVVRYEFTQAWRYDPLNPRRWLGMLAWFMPLTTFTSLYCRLKKLQARLEGKKASPHRFALSDDGA